MNWLSTLTRPGITTQKRKEVAAHVWNPCPKCGTLLYTEDLAQNLHVCSHCQHHLPWGVDTRLHHLLDPGFTLISVPDVPADPLKFKDTKSYPDRLAKARKATGQPDAYRVAQGSLQQLPLVVMAFDFSFMGGSMGRAVGQAIVVAAQTAIASKSALLIIPASGGARMQEGVHSLLQMARTTAALQGVKEAKLPYFVLLTDPTTGGVSASFAMLGDITLAEPGATIGFAGQRVIQQTIGEALPPGFQTAEYLLQHGFVDQVVPRGQQRRVLGDLLAILYRTNALNQPAAPPPTA